MRIAVAGGTGVVGRHVVAALEAGGHSVAVIARSSGADVFTGQGLDPLVEGADAIVDTTNTAAATRRRSEEFFERATGNLLAAAERAGVGHHVALSIVGIDRVDYGYYFGKRRQEELVRRGNIGWTILRATQFHEFPAQLLQRLKAPVVPVPKMRTQPVAAREVGERLAELATGAPSADAPDMGGPEAHDLVDLVRAVLRARGDRRRAVQLPLPGRVGRAMAGGALLTADGATIGRQTFADWLARSGGRAEGSGG